MITFYVKLEKRERTTPSMRTLTPPTEPGDTPQKMLWAFTPIDADGNITHPSNALIVNHHSPIHTYLEDADTLPNSELNGITTHSHYNINFSKNKTEEDGPS